MTKMLFPGSFDPITLGHVEIVEKARRVCDEITVVVTENPNKNSLISIDDRVELVKQSLSHLSNVVVIKSRAMVCDICDELEIYNIVRGLRNIEDFSFESHMNVYNIELNPRIETYFIMASNTKNHISSSGVREILKYNKKISHLVPSAVDKYFKEER